MCSLCTNDALLCVFCVCACFFPGVTTIRLARLLIIVCLVRKLGILKGTILHLSLFSLSPSREHVPYGCWVCLCAHAQFCVCMWVCGLCDIKACLMEGWRKGWSDSSDTGRWGGSQVEVVMIPQEGPLGLGEEGMDVRGGIWWRNEEEEDITLSHTHIDSHKPKLARIYT